MQGASQPAIWESSARPNLLAGDLDADTTFQRWRQECASRDYVRTAASLDIAGHHADEVFSLRYVLIHMIEEYARLNGHADLLREHIDGSTGE
jgi:uncharacterized protein DUF664